MQRVWRIFNKTTNTFMAAPRNATGTYATERGAKAGLAQLTKYGMYRAGREGFHELEIVPCYLCRSDEVSSEVDNDGQ
jgi:hypothetical protein